MQLVHGGWQREKHQEVKVVDQLLELLDGQVSQALRIIQTEDLLSLVTRKIFSQQNERGKEFSGWDVLVLEGGRKVQGFLGLGRVLLLFLEGCHELVMVWRQLEFEILGKCHYYIILLHCPLRYTSFQCLYRLPYHSKIQTQ